MRARRIRMVAIMSLSLVLMASITACSGLTRLLGKVPGDGRPVPMSLPGGLASRDGPGSGWSDQPVLSVSKKLLTETQTESGRTVQFVISIRNMGSRELTVVRVTDTFDPKHLSYEGATLAPDFWRNDGIMEWENLTGESPLRPGEKLSVVVGFEVVLEPEEGVSVETTNHVSVVAFDGRGRESLVYAATEAVRIFGPGFSDVIEPQMETMNLPPVAVIVGPSEGRVGQKLTFKGGESIDDHDSVVEYKWFFDDGATAVGAKVTHVFETAGTHEVTLRVTDDEGQVGEEQFVLEIGETGNSPPEAVIRGPSEGKIGQELSFTGDESHDDQGEIVLYKWTFGDGKTATGKNVTHVYKIAGTFTLKLRVEDAEGLRDVVTRIITIGGSANEPPVSVIIGPHEGTVGSELYFRGDESHDDNNDIVRYEWHFGDGTTATGKNVTHSYEAPGTYTVKLYVKDGAGVYGKSFHEVCIGGSEDSPPVAVIVAPGEVAAGSEVYFRGDESYDDHNDIVYYKWFFGDETKAYGKNVTHVYQTPGTYTVKLYVKDGSSQWGEAVHEIYVVATDNQPPNAVIIAPGEGAAGSELLFRGDESFDDHNDIVLYKWDFGDGSLGDGMNETHVYAEAGTYEVTLKVKDGGGLYGTATHTVWVGAPPNEPPVAEIIAPGEGVVGAEIFFRGDESYDDHDIVCYEWVFGEGIKKYGANVTYVFEAPGTYEVTLRVKDSGGLYGTTTHTIYIE